jgi:hypothetical protein
MQPYLLADSATDMDAAWAGAIGQWAGAIATVAAVLVALWLPRREHKRAESDRRAELAAEVIASVIDLRTALEVIRTRSNDRQARMAALAAAFIEVFGGGRPDGRRLASTLHRVINRNQAANDFAYTAFSGPMTRAYTALAHISFAGNEELRLAADGIRDAVGDIMLSFGDKTKWAKTSKRLDKAVADFRATTVRVTGAAKQ